LIIRRCGCCRWGVDGSLEEEEKEEEAEEAEEFSQPTKDCCCLLLGDLLLSATKDRCLLKPTKIQHNNTQGKQ
jgi:hypothetical protein